jgi:small subunit ribosomal protein S8
MDKISIFWFRRDLRLHDNVALFNALKSGEKVLPIFIFDTSILDKLPKNDARVSFIIKELRSMNEHLKSFDASIDILHGKPIEVFESLIKKYQIASVFTNQDYEPYAIRRDQEILELLKAEGYIIGYKVVKGDVQDTLRVTLKYLNNERVVKGLKRISKPGLRVYAKTSEIPKVLNGLGIAVISTSKGIMTDREARKQKTGGEILAYIW